MREAASRHMLPLICIDKATIVYCWASCCDIRREVSTEFVWEERNTWIEKMHLPIHDVSSFHTVSLLIFLQIWQVELLTVFLCIDILVMRNLKPFIVAD